MNVDRASRILALIVALLVSACTAQRTLDYRVKIDPALASFITVGAVITDQQGHLLRVDVQGENHGVYPVTIGYTIDWYDDAGLRIDTLLSGPRSLDVRPNGNFTLKGVAPAPAAADFRVHLFQG